MAEKRNSFQIVAPWSLTAAVKVAAEREMTSVSDYVRRALLRQLRDDGLDPEEFTPRNQEAGAAAAP